VQRSGVVVGDDEPRVKGLADAVSGVVAHHPVVEALGVGLDDAADDVDLAPRLDGLEAPAASVTPTSVGIEDEMTLSVGSIAMPSPNVFLEKTSSGTSSIGTVFPLRKAFK